MLDIYRPPQADFTTVGVVSYSTNIKPLTGLSRRDKMLVESKLRSPKSPVGTKYFFNRTSMIYYTDKQKIL
jgi:hypothetical protein